MYNDFVWEVFAIDNEKIYELLANSQDGTITTAEVTAAGLHRSVLGELVKSGDLIRVGCGLYIKSDTWEDEIYLLQKKHERGIFSHETALYLLGFTDRTPIRYTMTFPRGYSSPTLKREDIIIKHVIDDNYSFGIEVVESPCGNPVRVYGIERTLCDIVRGSGSDIQIVNDAMKRYAKMGGKDIHRLMKYAEMLRVKPKVLRYMEVLL